MAAREMTTDIDVYLTKGCGRCDKFDSPDCAAVRWADVIAAVRRACLHAGLTECVKWGSPCYMHAGRNITLIGAMKNDVRLSLFEAGLLVDTDGILEPNGPNTQYASILKLRSAEDVAFRADHIQRFLGELMVAAEAGKVAPKSSYMPDMPDELLQALDHDPEFAEAFAALTAGRQKSYLINLNGARKAQTRLDRIAKFRPKILAGKGATER